MDTKTAIPRMKVHIKRYALNAHVTITNSQGQTLFTTMDRGIEKSDPRITHLKRSFAHLPKVKS